MNIMKLRRNFISIVGFSRKQFSLQFKMNEQFISKYKNIKPNFGFNGLGELVYKRTYSRIKDNNRNEEWYETVQRVIEGTYKILIEHCDQHKIKYSFDDIQEESQRMYSKIFYFKFLPPGRGLWTMGSDIVNKKKIYAALNNCAFVSTECNRIEDFINPFLFLMDSAMLGVGVGFDTKGSKSNFLIIGDNTEKEIIHVVEDSREGWVTSLKVLLESHFLNKPKVNFDYSQIRQAGTPLKTFGGVSSGPGPLMNIHNEVNQVLTENRNKIVNSRMIVDVMNIIGKGVVSGNIRRSAEIALGESEDLDFLQLKDYTVNPDRASFGWVSNNSVYVKPGQNYQEIVKNIRKNGEPGLLWLDNMRKYSRMCDPIDNKDIKASGGNPCLEQTLESYEMCCLAEVFPFHHENLDEFNETLRLAFKYAKIVTLGKTEWEETNKVMSRNRRIGVSLTGLAQFIGEHGINLLKIWCEEGYQTLRKFDKQISNYLQIPESIKITSIKPSGTVSLLGGATPGVHYPHSRFYVRRVRLSKLSPLKDELVKMGYFVEDDVMQPETTVVVSFPIDLGEKIRTLKDVSLWEQFSLAAFMQKYWADNQVSCTVSFKNSVEGKDIESALDYFQYQLKGISMLPYDDGENVYKQMPYEEISKEDFLKLMANLKIDKGNLNSFKFQNQESKFCDNDSCDL